MVVLKSGMSRWQISFCRSQLYIINEFMMRIVENVTDV